MKLFNSARTGSVLLVAGMMIFAFSANTQARQAESTDGMHQDRVAELTKAFEGKGYGFTEKMNDPRFEYYGYIKKKFTGSAEKKIESVDTYKRAIGYDGKKRAIKDFMQTWSAELEAAEEKYGIPKYVIAAILGVESDFGKVKGSYNPFNVYVSMYAEDYRADFAKSQLEELLIFVKKNDLDVFEMESSYAGAMSHAQFIPYSLNRWFVGTELYNMENNIASVANYLAHFYERTGSMEKAVMRYNPSSLYTAAILSLAKDAEELTGSKGG